MRRISGLLVFMVVFLANGLYAQNHSIFGLWTITSVQVSDEEMTPVAKWTHLHEDFTFESGNGWLQNAAGTFEYDKHSGLFTAHDSLSGEDEFGGFSITILGDEMRWNRVEDGAQVTVMWNRIEHKPMAPWDRLPGMWQITEADESSMIYQAERLYIRWDHLFVLHTETGKAYGYWIMHAHKPELTLISMDESKPIERWQISFTKNGLLLKSGEKVVELGR